MSFSQVLTLFNLFFLLPRLEAENALLRLLLQTHDIEPPPPTVTNQTAHVDSEAASAAAEAPQAVVQNGETPEPAAVVENNGSSTQNETFPNPSSEPKQTSEEPTKAEVAEPTKVEVPEPAKDDVAKPTPVEVAEPAKINVAEPAEADIAKPQEQTPPPQGDSNVNADGEDEADLAPKEAAAAIIGAFHDAGKVKPS